MVELLTESGDMVGEPKPITHPVKFWENGNRPLEIVTSWQWFIKYPPTDELLARGRELHWFPDFMRVRYENWVNGLAGDWNITRQRFFGVPFPVWYPVLDDGTADRSRPITPDEARLPVDPSTDTPDGYDESQRGQPGGFVGDPDVMDTWATSSVSPHIVSGLGRRSRPVRARVPDGHAAAGPRDHPHVALLQRRPRRTSCTDVLPWRDAAISGFVHDPDRKKLSKSKGNSEDDPHNLLTTFGSDAIRYWAGNGRPGQDISLDKNQMKVGRRLAIKILNASKFVLGLTADEAGDISVSHPLDRAMLAGLAAVVDQSTHAFEAYDYARSLERTETFFWSFCDDYVELVKGRAYGAAGAEGAASASGALRTALSTLLRLFAPILPFVTEEVWSWWQEGSIHRAPWPDAADVRAAAGDGDPAVAEVTGEVLGAVRKAKSEAQRSMRAPVERVVVRDSADRIAALQLAIDDLKEAGSVRELVLEATDGPAGVDVALADDAA